MFRKGDSVLLTFRDGKSVIQEAVFIREIPDGFTTSYNSKSTALVRVNATDVVVALDCVSPFLH